MFELNEKELNNVNGGGLLGALVGYVVGVYAGAVVAAGTYVACTVAGEKGSMVSKAVATSFTCTVVGSTILGGIATGLI